MPSSSREHLFDELETFFGHTDTCRNSFRLMIHFAIRLAGSDDARRVLAIVERSPEAALFSPLIVGIRLHLGEASPTVDEAESLARQIAARIRAVALSKPPHQAVA